MPTDGENEVSVQLPYGPPPVLPDIEKQLKEYLLCPERLPIHNYEQAQQFWPRVPNPDSLFFCELSPLGTTLKVDRDPTTGEILQFREVPIDDIGCTARNSLSLKRAPQPFNESVRGNDSNFPFLPGGFPELLVKDVSDEQDTDIDFENDLLYIAPGFTRGIEFKADGHTRISEDDQTIEVINEVKEDERIEEEPSPAFNLMDVMKQEEDLLGLWKENSTQIQKDDKKDKEKMIIESMETGEDDALKVIPEKDNIPVLKISKAPPPASERVAEWAEKIDETLPVLDFQQKIPNPARRFHFDLDPFQQQAILKVEEHSNVFVAAHTSAGKTVVAEYAIALSRKHMTKTIYTSPIKALSNQKFRDFKKEFQDVGLITGDIQINKEANCLIMTTEILRSMLYQGSEVVRDLEFVIFDEVHYINNAERGHVWEEVLILLPKDVTIIMLSATVHNTLEFANWVGRTNQKMMYVISTLKRPIPLEHFLYTGTGGKQKNDRFLVMDGNGKFNEAGYSQAKQAKESKKPGKDAFGPKGPRPGFSQKQEKTMWEALISHLKEKDRLPVIAFTLSRNRCDDNARCLSVDLTTQREKSYIRVFFKKCLDKLKDCDKTLPQVQTMKSMLERGIGVHHSGILPLLKEMVEMLFQQEKVKLLFATETFAMGVNMPARTVIFDSIRKFNGQITQNLLPAEYIQMAGRAGRRGTDKKGTVIILCKNDVPKMDDLKSMMLGKPERLTSQFRLTYSMILRLLRVEKISVEDMMTKSFMEFKKQTRQSDYQRELQRIQDEIDQISVTCTKSGNDAELTDLYYSASEYLDHFFDTRLRLLSLPRALKDVQPGRVLLITYEEHVNKLALLLKLETQKREYKYHVLVLCNNENDYSGDGEIRLSVKTEAKKEEKRKKSAMWYKMLGLVNYEKVFVPDGISEHAVLIIGPNDIFEITTKSIKVNTELILNDWLQRQQPRFKDKEPGPSCMQAVQELTQMSLNCSETSFVQLYKDKINDIDFVKKLKRMEVLLGRVQSVKVANYPHFTEEFESVFLRRQLEKERDNFKHLQSHQSMTLYPDYQSKVQVLKNMGYINEDCAVDMKGNVAIKMRNHELLITEIVLRNILTDLPPAEIAALLSCLVCQQRTRFKDDKDPQMDLGVSLKDGIKKIKEIENTIKKEEKNCNVEQLPAINQDLSFELVRVVYEWAKGKPFSDIMTYKVDVQEGIIVRCIQQLSETINDVKDAASTIGNTLLKSKMEDAQKAIKRDIVFLASLYTSDTTLPKQDEIDNENKDE
ncbi:hypothetical protein R5R35_012172 [Gryllus longicercus]|uniref:Helicase SKI2W n=1 Tax=Gryllus longicercus TaxID=2509291 RepID=A0AAN9ZDA7_9ORTH